MSRTPRQIAAQVAVEAIVNAYGDGYDVETVRAVLAEAEEVGVADIYVDMLRDYA